MGLTLAKKTGYLSGVPNSIVFNTQKPSHYFCFCFLPYSEAYPREGCTDRKIWFTLQCQTSHPLSTRGLYFHPNYYSHAQINRLLGHISITLSTKQTENYFHWQICHLLSWREGGNKSLFRPTADQGYPCCCQQEEVYKHWDGNLKISHYQRILNKQVNK